MGRIITAVIVTCFLLALTGCGGGGDSSNSSSSENSGPLAGVWMGTAKGVMHTINISGSGNVYTATWETSNKCFTSETGTTVQINDQVEILCSGYDAGRDRYLYPDINGKFDGGNAISGTLHSISCGISERVPIVLTR